MLADNALEDRDGHRQSRRVRFRPPATASSETMKPEDRDGKTETGEPSQVRRPRAPLVRSWSEGRTGRRPLQLAREGVGDVEASMARWSAASAPRIRVEKAYAGLVL